MAERILVVSPEYWPENTKINDICEGFAKRGYSIDVICGQPQTPDGRFFEGYHSFGHKEERRRGVRILRHFETKKGSGTGFRIMLNYLTSTFSANRTLRRVRKRRYGAVLIFQTSPVMICSTGLRAAKRRNIPAVTYAIDIWPEKLYRELDMQSPILKAVFRSISDGKYKASTEIVTLTKTAEQYFTGGLDIHPGRVRCLVPGPDSFILKAKDDVSLLERFYGSFNIVTSDPILQRQDYATVLAAAAMIRDTGLIGIRMIIVCSCGAADLKKKVSKAGLNDIVFIEQVGSEEKSAPYYRIANAFLSCERPAAGDEYSFPHDLINYMSAGKPVIFAGDGDGRRIIRDAGCGVTLDPEDAESLYNAVMTMYRTPKSELDAMGTNAALYQQEHYNTEKCVDELLEVLFRENGDDEFIISGNTNIIRSDDLFEE